MKFFKIKNWDDFQHYTDRSPPWIKLYNHILDDYTFTCLQDASKLHLVLIWLLASRNSNHLPYDSNWIKSRISVNSKINLDELLKAGFIELENNEIKGLEEDALPCLQDASKVLQTVEQSACLEREERESRAEQRRREKSKKFIPPSVEQVKDYCLERNNGIDPEVFVNHYQTCGWVRGKTKIKDWKACVITWEKKPKEGPLVIQQTTEERFTDRSWAE